MCAHFSKFLHHSEMPFTFPVFKDPSPLPPSPSPLSVRACNWYPDSNLLLLILGYFIYTCTPPMDGMFCLYTPEHWIYPWTQSFRGVFIRLTGMDHWTTGMDLWNTGMDYWNTGMDYGNMPVTSLKYHCQPYTCMHACTERLF